MNLSRILNPSDSEDSQDIGVPQQRDHSPPSLSLAEIVERQLEDADDGLPSTSFIVVMEAEGDGKVCYVSPSVLDVLGYEVDEVIGTPAALYCHPDDAPNLYRAYQEMISEDKAACIMYHRVPYKDRSKGHLLCTVSASRAGRHLVGACSPATSATKAMHNASTAQEVIVITPSAARLAFRRWNVPSAQPNPTMPTSSPHPSTSSREATPPSPGQDGSSPEPVVKAETEELSHAMRSLTLSPPSKPQGAPRVAMVLDRFSLNVPVIFATNDNILPRSLIMGRSLFDFITAADETRMRQAIETVKEWGANESGGPNEGGFAFNRFHLYLRGRDSSIRPEPASLRKRRPAHNVDPPTTSDKVPDSSINRNRHKQRHTAERGVNAPTRDTLLVDSIFSPQSDGIVVVLRPALTSGVQS